MDFLEAGIDGGEGVMVGVREARCFKSLFENGF